MKTLSIIIPMYNAEQYIERTIRSIIRNDSPELELIIVDDGSTDNGAEIAKSILNASNHRMTHSVISSENQGVSIARNRGISASTGEYILFCDSDDELLPGLAERILSIRGSAYDFVFWPFINEKDGRTNTTKSLQSAGALSRNDALDMYLFREYKLRLGSFAVKRNVVESHNIKFTDSCQIGEDIEFILKCLLHSEKVYTLESPYYIYHRHEGSLAYSYNIRRFEASNAISRIYEYYCNSVLRSKLSPLTHKQADYIHNGLFILHTMYALDSCLDYITKPSELHKLSRIIKELYPNLASLINTKLSQMKISPPEYPARRIHLLKVGFPIYIHLTGIHNLLQKKRTR